MATERVATPGQRADQAAATEQDRRISELRAARESGVLLQAGNRPVSSGTAQVPQAGPGIPAADGSKLAIDADRDPNAQQRKADFVASPDKGSDINSHQLALATSPNMLSAGSVIAASLITGLRSDLPGLVTAQVTERVYDSATGSILLVPQGARLIGSYDSVVAFGQRRALIVWQRIILPDGSSVRLDNVPATDPSGYAGLADKVDFHTWSLLKGVAISTLLGVGANVTFSGESDFVQAIRESTQQNASRAGDQITSRNLQIQPTITIRPGAPVRLVVHRDLILAPWKG
ncbi:TrbI/VirB10 family protein [Sphingomonas aurantiaca]|uniref:TrbI/VirB10 family protein n=1 Tax=Sphingomonas aurantiaca TaxID=185949 RepID=UPI002FE01A89